MAVAMEGEAKEYGGNDPGSACCRPGLAPTPYLISSPVKSPASTASAYRAEPEGACGQRLPGGERRRPATGGPRRKIGGIHTCSPKTRTQPRGRTHPAASLGSVPTGAPMGCGRNRTRLLGVSCAPSDNQHAGEGDRSAPNDALGVLGGRRAEGGADVEVESWLESQAASLPTRIRPVLLDASTMT